MAAHAICHAQARTSLDPAEVEDVILGCGYPEAATGGNVARHAALVAGLPVGSSGAVVSRFCASGLEAVAAAARRIAFDGVPVAIAGGVESISLVQPVDRALFRNDWLVANKPDIYATMIETGDIVAQRYGISRDAQDGFALLSQQRTAQAQTAGIYDVEIVPITVEKIVSDKATGETRKETVTLASDEGNRPDTTLEGLARLQPVRGEEQFVTAGNASQLSDGASASVLMASDEAARRGIEPLAIFRGYATAGVDPDEMGSGRLSPFRACSNATGSRLPISACGRSTRRSLRRQSIAATG